MPEAQRMPQKVVWWFILFILLLVVGSGAYMYRSMRQNEKISTYDQCIAAGHPIMLTNPSQCQADGQTFSEKH